MRIKVASPSKSMLSAVKNPTTNIAHYGNLQNKERVIINDLGVREDSILEDQSDYEENNYQGGSQSNSGQRQTH